MAHKPDLVILDWIMPELDGIDAARRILSQMPAVPIVMNSLFVTSQLVDSARKAGIRQVVSKMDGNQLIKTVKALLPHRHA
jgi:DNA-binding NarL/FixJ family response regulator